MKRKSRLDKILTAIRGVGGASLNPMKAESGNEYSFGKIRAVMSPLEFFAK